MKVEKAVILAAGKGTRFLPFTKAYPKEMLAVADKPALQLIAEEIAASGIRDILIIISPDKQAVRKHFEKDAELVKELYASGKDAEAKSVEKLNDLAEFSFAYQKVADGTGSAVLLAQEFADGKPFAVLNGDDVMSAQIPVTAQLAAAYENCGKTVVGVQKVERSQIVKYAACKLVSQDGRLYGIDDIVEKPKSDSEIFSLLAPLGRYVLTPDIFDAIRSVAVRPNGETYLTDALQLMAQNGGIYAYEFDGKRYDFGDKLGYIKGFTEIALADVRYRESYRRFLEELLKK